MGVWVSAVRNGDAPRSFHKIIVVLEAEGAIVTSIRGIGCRGLVVLCSTALARLHFISSPGLAVHLHKSLQPFVRFSRSTEQSCNNVIIDPSNLQTTATLRVEVSVAAQIKWDKIY